MKLCIISGIFEPEAGGPATYAPRLAAALSQAGYAVTVVTFSNQVSYPGDSSYPFRLIRVVRGSKLFNRIRFFFACAPHIRISDCIYMLDWFAAGGPASLAARIFKKPYVVRVGGDYLWEQRYLESGEQPISLAEFYARNLHTRTAYRMYAGVISRVLQGAAHVVFNAEKMRALYVRHWGLVEDKTSVIWNPVPRKETGDIHRDNPSNEFVFWGRFIVMKNIASLVKAFAKADLPTEFSLTLIGEGPRKAEIAKLVKDLGLEKRIAILPGMPQHGVLERVKNARAFILPSWTDIAPNQVYEALAIGIPSIVTKENYLPIAKDLPMMIDPNSVDDIAEALRVASREEEYRVFSEAFRTIRFDQGWGEAATQHIKTFEKVV